MRIAQRRLDNGLVNTLWCIINDDDQIWICIPWYYLPQVQSHKVFCWSRVWNREIAAFSCAMAMLWQFTSLYNGCKIPASEGIWSRCNPHQRDLVVKAQTDLVILWPTFKKPEWPSEVPSLGLWTNILIPRCCRSLAPWTKSSSRL